MTVETAPHKRRFVVAGNFAQFRNWQGGTAGIKVHAESDVYVLTWRDLQGLNPEKCRVIYVGTYYMRGDIARIREEVACQRLESSYSE